MRSSLLFVLLLAVAITQVRGPDPAPVDPNKPGDAGAVKPGDAGAVKPGDAGGGGDANPPAEECDCEDELPEDVCDATFAKVADNCNKLPSAMKCAKSCKMCCKLKRFDCKDKIADQGNQPPLKCKSIKELDYCGDTKEPMKEIVNEWCQHTCGKCCKDDDPDLCKIVKNDCENPKTQAKCQLTCGMCNTDGCVDEYDKCKAVSSHCNGADLKDMMAKFCKRTCGICGGGPAPSVDCKDAKTGCTAWVQNGFCTSAEYTNAVKREYCAKSCGLC